MKARQDTEAPAGIPLGQEPLCRSLSRQFGLSSFWVISLYHTRGDNGVRLLYVFDLIAHCLSSTMHLGIGPITCAVNNVQTFSIFSRKHHCILITFGARRTVDDSATLRASDTCLLFHCNTSSADAEQRQEQGGRKGVADAATSLQTNKGGKKTRSKIKSKEELGF